MPPKYTPEKATNLFWKRVNILSDSDACWEWQARLDKYGYGETSFCGARIKAHRLAYKLTYGDIPDGKLIMHSCDNPACCNPKHLTPGTNLQNIEDRERKGRTSKGESHYKVKLTDAQIREIRARYIPGVIGYRTLANEYGVYYGHIADIVKGKTRKDA